MDATRLRAALFVEDFDEPAIGEPEVISPDADPAEPPEPMFTEQELEAARHSGHAEGLAAGRIQAEQAREAATLACLDGIAAGLRASRQDAVAAAEAAIEDAARLMLTMLAAALPAFCARHGEAEVRAVVATLLPRLTQEPAVTIRVSPLHAEALRADLARLDAEEFGHVRLVPTDAIAPGDVRLTWAYGDATRNAAALARDIADALAPLGLLMPDPAPARKEPVDA
jgi:flagellar biosynthesis/type III secretory pathway protein FliH